MMWFTRHVDTTTLSLVALGDEANPRAAAHLAACASCRQELDQLVDVFAAEREAVAAAVDLTFGPAELERQREAIRRRITAAGGEHRVLPFPRVARHAPPTGTTDHRWLIAAAAVGLCLGIALGQVPRIAGRPQEMPAAMAAPQRSAADPADDTLLRDIDDALAVEPRPELSALDALTPVHYETR